MDKLFTPDQVAEMLQLHPFTVLNYIKAGQLRAARLGRVYRVRESDINAFLEAQMVSSTAEVLSAPAEVVTT